ncbi:MAG: trypsin-like peptidase domain-containing protein [Oscillospiraceae bacterium]|nr:trypsin-like peptidase domain-containing protein [Oscillospiraceae bacterium]
MTENEIRTDGVVENENPVNEQANSAPKTEPPRVDGEYHFKNEFNESVYSDAHYVPASENTVPPRYYKPPQKPVKESKAKRNGNSSVKLIAICLVCALLGSMGGGALVGFSLSNRIDGMEAGIQELMDSRSVLTTSNGVSVAPVQTAPEGGITPAAIYDLACDQVVGISSEITYTNFFGMTSSSAVTGSGFIITEDGYILTNYHVIENAYASNSTVNVITHEGERYDAEIIGFEPDNDVAVLKIDAEGLTPAVLGNSDQMQVGDVLYAVGNPLGELEFTMTIGYVSALDRLINTEANTAAINMFQLDAAINSGNSGGPVYNSQGEVIGVATAKYSSSGVEGLGFAIPINDAADIANDLITKGYVTGKAYMGVSLDNRYNSMYSQYYGMPIGAYVAGVEEGSCAEKAGIQTGDIITQLGDYEIDSYNALKSAVKQFSAGDTTELTLFRAGESMNFSITFDEAQPEKAQPVQ